MTLPRISLSRRLILPGAGVAIFLIAYAAQNIWNVFHIEDITGAIRSLDRLGMSAAIALLGFIEGMILLCFYVPGTAVTIVLLIALSPGWGDALSLLTGLMVGTMAGYLASMVAGRVMQDRLPALVGERAFRKVQSLIDRYGLLSLVVIAIHPNQLALAFAVLGYFRAAHVWRYFAVAAVLQAFWWAVFASVAGLFVNQTLVTSSNFQLYVATAFGIWFLYELFSRPHPVNVP